MYYIVIKHDHVSRIVYINMVLSYSGHDGWGRNNHDVKVLLRSNLSLLIEHQIRNGMRTILNLSHDEHLCLFLYM